jgi:hypothetical protein
MLPSVLVSTYVISCPSGGVLNVYNNLFNLHYLMIYKTRRWGYKKLKSGVGVVEEW